MSYVKPVAYIGGTYILFEIARAMWWELKINSHNSRILQAGGIMNEEDTEEKQ
jgi:hypothetical protein